MPRLHLRIRVTILLRRYNWRPATHARGRPIQRGVTFGNWPTWQGGSVPFQFFKQTISVLASTSTTNGAIGAVEVGGPGGAVPPLHVHRREDEAFYIIEGDDSVFIGDDVITASPGTWVWGPRDVPHGCQVHSERGRHLSLMMPGGFEAFFEEVATMAAEYGVELLGPAPAPN